jgi:DNA-binding MarR family transcriptional regulator
MSTRDTASAVEDTSWLTPAEGDAWWPFAVLLAKLPDAFERQLQRDSGLGHFEYMILSQLSQAPRRSLRMSFLAVVANGSLSRLSHAVKRLERRGWVRREPCPDDGRYTNAILTDAGHAKVEAAAPGHVRAVRELVIDALTPAQLQQLREIGEDILGRMDPDALRRPEERGTHDAVESD